MSTHYITTTNLSEILSYYKTHLKVHEAMKQASEVALNTPNYSFSSRLVEQAKAFGSVTLSGSTKEVKDLKVEEFSANPECKFSLKVEIDPLNSQHMVSVLDSLSKEKVQELHEYANTEIGTTTQIINAITKCLGQYPQPHSEEL